MRTLFLVGATMSFLALVSSAPPSAALSTDTPGSTAAPSALRTDATASQDFLTFKSSYLDPPKQIRRLIDLPLELDDRRTLKTLANTSLFHGLIKGEGELMYAPPVPGSVEQRGNSDRRQLRLGMTGSQGAFRYGISMREAGKAAAAAPDQATRELWGEWRFGIAQVRTSLSDLWTNVDKDQSRTRLTQSQERVALTLVRPSWPQLTVAYTRTAVANTADLQGVAAQQRALAGYESAVAYGGSGWTASASAGYTMNADRLTPGLDSRALTYAVNGSYKIERLLTITPSLNLRDELQRWSGVRILSRSGSMTLAYTPDPTLSLTALAAYNETSSTDHLLTQNNFNATNTVTWKPESLAKFHASLSLETSHKVTHNQLGAPQSLEDTSGLVRLQFADVVIW